MSKFRIDRVPEEISERMCHVRQTQPFLRATPASADGMNNAVVRAG